MMKAQASLEFTVYAAISIAALFSAITAYLAVGARYSSMESNAELITFISSVNANIEYTNSTFRVFVPNGVCGAVQMQHSTAFDAQVELSNSLCGSAGAIRTIRMTMAWNGTFVLSVVR
ncbi:MAG: hypothetical protein M1500_00700 [Candidatus Marsarchaeota archaeon]|nr:hypothetical protein [Candidatus Marsarchaeota archaeon]MCL5112222.1 hypothetical protein [Candidatus Marsarchaeota archaeon]